MSGDGPSVASHLAKALEQKSAGNEKLKAASPKQACFHYKQALMFVKPYIPTKSEDSMVSMLGGNRKVPLTPDEEAEARKLAVVLHSNIAQARIKLEDWDGAISHANDAIALDSACTKAYFRRGVAYLGRNDCAEARADFERVGKEDPASVAQHMSRLVQAEQQESKRQDSMFKKMFAA